MRLFLVFLIFAAGAMVFMLLARRREEDVEEEWEKLLNHEAVELFEAAMQYSKMQLNLIDLIFGTARSIRDEQEDYERAARTLSMGYKSVEDLGNGLVGQLAAMSRFSRMLGAITPPPPLLPSSFRLSHLVQLSYMHRKLDSLIREPLLRFKLRLCVLAKALRLTLFVMGRRVAEIVARPRATLHLWDHVEACYADFHTLHREYGVSLGALLASLEAARARLRLIGDWLARLEGQEGGDDQEDPNNQKNP